MVFPATFLWMSQSDRLWSKSCSKTISVICVNNGQSMPSAWALKSRKGIAAISPTLCYVSGFNCVCPREGRQGIMYTWLSCISLSEGVCFVCFQRKQWNTDTNSISSTENPMSFTYVSSGHSERLGVGGLRLCLQLDFYHTGLFFPYLNVEMSSMKCIGRRIWH